MTLKDVIKDGALTQSVLFHAGMGDYTVTVDVPAGTPVKTDVDGDYVVQYGTAEVVVQPHAPVVDGSVYVTEYD